MVADSKGADSTNPGPQPNASELARLEAAMGDNPGAPTWPIQAPEPAEDRVPPPVGLNWGAVAQRLGVPLRLLQHDGAIVLAGEYFPESGYFLNPATLHARFVDVGEIALKHGYFLGELAIRDFRVHVPIQQETGQVVHPVIRPAKSRPIIAVFRRESDAQRARGQILQNSLGSGASSQSGPLGIELRIERPTLGGRVATVLASHGGAIVSVGGRAIAPPEPSPGPSATGPSIVGEQAPAPRPGTGVASDVQVKAADWGGSEESRK